MALNKTAVDMVKESVRGLYGSSVVVEYSSTEGMFGVIVGYIMQFGAPNIDPVRVAEQKIYVTTQGIEYEIKTVNGDYGDKMFINTTTLGLSQYATILDMLQLKIVADANVIRSIQVVNNSQLPPKIANNHYLYFDRYLMAFGLGNYSVDNTSSAGILKLNIPGTTICMELTNRIVTLEGYANDYKKSYKGADTKEEFNNLEQILKEIIHG